MDDDELRELLGFYYQSFAGDIDLFAGPDLRGSHLSSEQPMAIADLSGAPLFTDFQILDRSNDPIGFMRSTAPEAASSFVDSIVIGEPPIDEAGARANILAQAQKDSPGCQVSTGRIVCYGYPRLGMQVDALDADGNHHSAIYDLYGFYRVLGSLSGAVAQGLESGDYEGEPLYSWYDALPEAGNDGLNLRWADSVDFAQRFVLDDRKAHHFIQPMSDGRPAPKVPAMRGVILPVELIAQESPVWCVVASAAMILTYLGFGDHSQEDIAHALNTGAAGTLNEDFQSGIAALTSNAWSGQLIQRPTFESEIGYLEQMLPAKSGINGHARVLRGWREYVYLAPRTGQVEHRESFYVVNDPYPVGKGHIILENAEKPIADFYRNAMNFVATPTPAGQPDPGGDRRR